MGEPSTFQEFLADRCPALRRLEFGRISKKGKGGTWRVSELAQIGAFMSVADLPKAFFKTYVTSHPGGSYGSLCFLAQKQRPRATDVISMNDLLSAYTDRIQGQPFNIEEEMEGVTSATKARRVAGTQKAQATKAANQAVLAAGGPAAEAMIKAGAQRKEKEKRRAAARKAAMASVDDSEEDDQ